VFCCSEHLYPVTVVKHGISIWLLLQMQAELQMLSPLVPIREVTFLRFCKQLAEGAWAVVDVSIDGLQTDQCLATNTKCRRLPSGCVLQDTPNGCKVCHSNSSTSFSRKISSSFLCLVV
jgi:hypothetical protein